MSDITEWLSSRGLDILQSVGIVSGILFAAFSYRRSTNASLLHLRHQVMLSHRDLWDRYTDSPELHRILDDNANMIDVPITLEEERFVISLVSHAQFIFEAHKYKHFYIRDVDILISGKQWQNH